MADLTTSTIPDAIAALTTQAAVVSYRRQFAAIDHWVQQLCESKHHTLRGSTAAATECTRVAAEIRLGTNPFYPSTAVPTTIAISTE